MGYFVSSNAQRYFQHFQTADFLAKRRVETRATLFNVSEVKARYVRDRLNMVVTGEVGVGSAIEIVVVSGNGGHMIEFKSLREGGAKIGVGGAAIAHVPTGVHIEMHKVRETPNVLRTRSLAAFECSELIQVDGICALGFQISVEKRCMTDFVESVAGYILRSITIEVRQGYLIVVQRLVRVYFDGWIIANTA